MRTTVLKPGYLVSLSTRLEGGVKYTRVDLDANAPVDDAAKVSRWETTKLVEDAEEHARAVKVRGKCSSLIRSVCAHSAFGLLCPASSEQALDEAIAEARDLAKAFNASAKASRISVYVLKGKIAESDSEAARAISSEMTELLGEMRTGIADMNVTAIREAASKAKRVGAMLDADASRKVTAAIEEAREVAKQIVKRLVEDADSVAPFVQEIKLQAMDEARFAFLDLDESTVVVEPMPAEPRALDLDANEDAEAAELEANEAAEVDDKRERKAATGDVMPEIEC